MEDKITVTSRRIWKYQLPLMDQAEVEMPKGSQALSVGLDPGGLLCVWVKATEAVENEVKLFRIAGTGHVVDTDGLNFIGTATDRRSAFVWHVWEKVS